MIPKSRLDQEIAKKKELQSQLDELTAGQKNQENLKTQLSDYQTRFAALETEIKTERMRYATDVTMLKQGVTDPKLIDYVRWNYGRVETEEGKDKPEFDGWLKSFQEDNKSLFSTMQASPSETVAMGETTTTVEAKDQTDDTTVAKGSTTVAKDTTDNGVITAGQPLAGKLNPRQIASLSKEEFGAYKASLAAQLKSA